MDWPSVRKHLRAPLDRAHVRPPPKGKYGEYIEGWHAIAEANRIFGEEGWSANVHTITPTNSEVRGDTHHVGYMAMCTITVDGVSRTDVGHGQGHSKSAGDAHDSAVKEAATDAVKRALRTFGNPFGLALYDKTKSNVVDIAEKKRTDDDRASKAKAFASQIASSIDNAGDHMAATQIVIGNAAGIERAWGYEEARQIIADALSNHDIGLTFRDGRPDFADGPARLLGGG